MITLIHGEDNLSSREFYLAQKDGSSMVFDAEIINIIELSHSIQGSGLFNEPKKILIENLFTRKGVKNLQSIGEVLEKTNKIEVFIWVDKEVGVKALSDFPKFENKNFKIPQNIWSFLDGIKPQNPSNIVNFQNCLKTSDSEFIFAMIIRQFRLMLGISSKSVKNADEVQKLVPWQKTKLTKQASMFGLPHLKQIYKKLYKIEKSVKTGSSSLNLVQNIDILLLEI